MTLQKSDIRTQIYNDLLKRRLQNNTMLISAM